MSPLVRIQVDCALSTAQYYQELFRKEVDTEKRIHYYWLQNMWLNKACSYLD